jgi:hypothetical protein
LSIRDVQFDFSTTLSGNTYTSTTSLVNNSGSAYLFPNTLDTSPLVGYLTALTASDTQLSLNVNSYREMGGGERLWVVVDIITAVAATGGAATVDFALITSASTGLGSATTILDFGAIAKGTLIAGYRLIGAIPRTTTWLQYLGLQYTIATNNITAGTAVAWLAWDIDAVVTAPASGFSIK